ncbi:MAG: hypothetical protein NTW21_12135 [Verrucomicrobia bacterium]|nr:hypothetical protein [Verrucomicrobiota bacterium]
MVTFKLTHIEFAAIATFLEAESIPGLDITTTLDDAQMLEARRQLQKHGYMVAGDRPDTWHVNDPLIDVTLTVVSSDRLVLVKDIPGKRSMQFCLDQDHITAVVVLDDGVVLVLLEDRLQMAAEAISFLRNTEDGVVAAASVVGGKVVKGLRARTFKDKLLLDAGEQPLTPRNLLAFLQPLLGSS